MSIPVHLADGSLYGTLCATSTARKPLSERGEQVLKLFAGLIAQSIQKESLVTQLREANAALIAHSYTDALTGLPNRRAIFEDLTTLFSLARHLKRNAIIAFIDLDDFKLINDRYGHEAGDQFLIEVGKRLTEEKQQDDIIGRLGGDEFLVASLSTSHRKGITRRSRCSKRASAPALPVNTGWVASTLFIREPASALSKWTLVTDPDSALRARMWRCIRIRKEKAKHAFSLWINPVHSTALQNRNR
jgi:diguanylate cyclase